MPRPRGEQLRFYLRYAALWPLLLIAEREHRRRCGRCGRPIPCPAHVGHA